jgi:hypothetical protein
MIPAPHVMAPSASIPNWWWSLPAILGFIGGIISWVKQKDVNRRKAMNMLTLGILSMLIWPTLITGVNILSNKTPPAATSAAMEVDSSPIEFTELEATLGKGGSRTLTISNTGGQPLTGSVTNHSFWLMVSPVEINVAPGSTQDISIWLDNDAAKWFSTTYISIATNGGNQQIMVTLKTANPQSITPSTPSPTPQPETQLSFAAKTYTNDKYGFSIQYPDKWVERPELVTVKDIHLAAFGVEAYVPGVVCHAFPADKPESQEWIVKSFKSTGNTKPKVTSDIKEITLSDGTKAYTYKAKYISATGYEVISYCIDADRGDKRIRVNVFTIDSFEHYNEALASEIAHTLRFTQ